ncbi:hypothetical protein [Hydrogenimonas sp.]
MDDLAMNLEHGKNLKSSTFKPLQGKKRNTHPRTSVISIPATLKGSFATMKGAYW